MKKSHIYDLKELILINNEIRETLKKHQDYLYSFKHDDGGFFFRKKEDQSNLTSTVTCTNSLIDAQNDVLLDKKKIFTNIISRDEWTSAKLPKDNFYTVPMLIYGLNKLLDTNPSIDTRPERIKNSLENIKTEIQKKGGLNVLKYPKNAYLTFWGIMSYCAYYGSKNTLNELEKGFEWLEKVLYRQIALFHANDEIEKDIFQLGYSLIILMIFNYNIDNPIIKKAISIIFNDQNDDGSWDKYHPLFHYPEVGNAYCYTFELISDVFLILNKYNYILENYIENFEKVRNWTKNYEISDKTEEGTYGWCSYHHADWKKPESWATAKVFDFLRLYNAFIESLIKKILLNELNAKTITKNYWDDILLDAELIIKKTTFKLKSFINKKIIELIKSKKDRKAYGIMFFGPPGTGKTLYAKAIAQMVNWPLIVLNPRHFLAEGFSGVVRNASEIFKKLEYLEKVVVLFDEMDELMRERSSEFEFETRFFTTSMLPLISDLHAKQDFVYIFNTNVYKSIDPAIKRPGRFDFQLFVGPPLFEEKIEIIKNEMNKHGFSEGKINITMDQLKSNGNRGKIELFLYHEILNLSSEICNIKSDLSDEDYTDELQKNIDEEHDSIYLVKKNLIDEYNQERLESKINIRI